VNSPQWQPIAINTLLSNLNGNSNATVALSTNKNHMQELMAKYQRDIGDKY
jgi:hypothetical protein